MNDTTVSKVDSRHSPRGTHGQTYLALGKSISMRLWDEPAGTDGEFTTRGYETVGYVIEGEAELEIEGQTLRLEAGNSWVVPPGASHRYRVTSHFKAVEATSPPAELHNRDK